MKPTITIIMATYNRAHFILETLHSIQNQTYENWECIIIDDGGTDNTQEVIAPLLDKDTRFSYLIRKNSYYKGLSGCRNYGLDLIEKSNSAFICFFDDDDIMHPKKLELQINPFLNDETVSMTTCQYMHFYKTEELDFKLSEYDCLINTNNLFLDFYTNKIGVNSGGPLWKKEIFANYRFDDFLPYSEERDLYLKIFIKEKINYVPVNYVLFYYRKHNFSNTSLRYSGSVLKTAMYKSDLNFYNFLNENKLWNKFLIKEYLNKFLISYNEPQLAKELIVNSKQGKIKDKVALLMLTIIIKLKLFINKSFLLFYRVF